MFKVRTLITGFIAGVTCLALAVAPASADPDAVREARIQLERIQQEASAIDQEIIEAAVRAQESEEKLEQINDDLTAQKDKVARMSDALGQIAVMQMQSGGVDLTAQLFSSDSDRSFLSGLATIQNETNRGNSDIQAFQLEQAKLDQLQVKAEETNRSIQADLEAKEELAEEYEAKEAEAQAVYDRLEAEERERLRQIELERQRQQEEADRLAREREQQRQQQEEAAAAAAATQSESNSSNGSNNSNSSENSTAAASNQSSGNGDSGGESSESSNPAPAGDSSRAQAAVNAALSKVGSRYVWGTSGPNTFDCSGLTSWAYRQVGITLPRSSRAQAGMGTAVSKANLRPGDLVFYYSPISHVGLYIGNGQIVDAANPRSGVRVTSLNSMPYSGARRVA